MLPSIATQTGETRKIPNERRDTRGKTTQQFDFPKAPTGTVISECREQERKSAKVREKRGEAREAYRELEEAEEAHENLRQCAPPAMEAEQGKRQWHDRCRAVATEGAEAGYGEHPPGEGDVGGDGGPMEA